MLNGGINGGRSGGGSVYIVPREIAASLVIVLVNDAMTAILLDVRALALRPDVPLVVRRPVWQEAATLEANQARRE